MAYCKNCYTWIPKAGMCEECWEKIEAEYHMYIGPEEEEERDAEVRMEEYDYVTE